MRVSFYTDSKNQCPRIVTVRELDLDWEFKTNTRKKYEIEFIQQGSKKSTVFDSAPPCTLYVPHAFVCESHKVYLSPLDQLTTFSAVIRFARRTLSLSFCVFPYVTRL